MATPISDLITQARRHLTELAPASFTDEELLDHARNGAKDLWRRIIDLYQHHFVTFDETNVYAGAESATLRGMPDDCFRVVSIEPRVVGANNACPGLIFKPKDYNDPRFVQARARGPIEPRNAVVYYDVMTTGAPVAAPMIRIAPTLSSDADLILVYNHVLARFDEDDDNPIPGESDNALIAWIVAYAKAKERDDRAPDPEWLAVYATEKNNCAAACAKRQIQESDVVQGMFEDDAEDE